MMKKTRSIALIAALSLFVPTVCSGFDLAFRLSSGLGWLKADEVNTALAGWREGWKRQVEADPRLSFLGENFGSLHIGLDFEAELLLSFSRWLGLGISAGYSHVSLEEKQTLFSIYQDGILNDHARPTKVSALPVLVSAYVFLPLSQKFSGYLRGGLGILQATYMVRESNKVAGSDRFTYPIYDKGRSHQLSYVGGLGLTYEFDQSLGFFAEVVVRSARASSFEGEDKQGVKGRFYAYEEYRSDIDFWQLQTRILPEPPAGNSVRNVREATVDFSGYSARIGLFLKI